MEIPNEYIKNLYRALFSLLVVLAVFFAVKVATEIWSIDDSSDKDQNNITLTGHGEVKAVPDIANVYFTIHKDGKTVKEAQEAVATIEKNALDFLKKSEIAEKDIQTTNASFNPKYESQRLACPMSPMATGANVSSSFCGYGKQVIVGYEAYESITVKLRVPDDSGKVMQGLGTLGVTDLSGPNFDIDNKDGLQAEARKKAIDDASTKAKVLAKDLGVRLGHVANFSEGGAYPMMYSEKAMSMDSVAGAVPAPANIPKGENTISSDVTITYIIK
ncbi:SIMPL domain-containing protein [Patescibacteria group bacterium]|nr:SIMPL domain-containing protein [Patescibacteria group bacterium]